MTADDGNGGTTIENIVVSVTNVNEGDPVFTSPATQSVPENTTPAFNFTTTDADGDTVTYSFSGLGNDNGLFTLTPAGELTFTNPPNFEAPLDGDGLNDYNVQVTADDGNGGTTIENIVVSVTNVNEAPTLNPIGNPSVLENSAGIIATVTASDVDTPDTLTYSLAGVDAGLFSIDNVTGAISFTAPDFENPLDNGANNVYDIQVIVEDAAGLQDTQNIAVTVMNVNEAPTSGDQQFSVSGNSVNGSLVGTVTATDIDTGDTLSYAITDGTGIGSFAIDSTTGQISIVNSNSLYSEVAQVYTLSVLVTDSTGATSVSNIIISVSPSTTINPVIVSPPPPEQTNPSPERVDFIAEPTYQLAGYIFNSHLITPLESASDNNGANESNGESDSRDVKVDWLTSANAETGSDYLGYRAGGAFYNALDKMNQDIDDSEDSRSNNIFTAGVRGTGIALTAGFASWVLRGGSLLASFLSTIPVWRGLDPLPILAAARKKQQKDVYIANSKKNKSDADDIEDTDDLFQKNGNNISKNPVQDA